LATIYAFATRLTRKNPPHPRSYSSFYEIISYPVLRLNFNRPVSPMSTMKKFKSFFRLVGLTMLVILALCGVGFLGALFPVHRDQQNKPMTIERKDEDSEEKDEVEIKD
jgi:hypothetical protein